MKDLISEIISIMIDFLPGFILKMIHSPQKVAKEIKIDLRGEKPIDVNLNSEVPNIIIVFKITNLSNLNLVLDRMLIELWFGQPTLYDAILERREIHPRTELEKDIFYRSDLTQAQCRQINDFGNGQFSGQIDIHVIAYFESKVGIIEVKKTLNRRSII